MNVNHSLILICGRPGSGKSTLAKKLAQELRAVLIDKDCIDEAFSPGDRGPLYRETIQMRAYQTLLNLAEPNLLLQQHVILDAPWTHNLLNHPHLAEKVLQLSVVTGARLVVFEVDLKPDVVKQRLTQRGFKRDEAKLTPDGWKEFAVIHRIGEKNPLPHFLIDGERSPEECLQQAMITLQEKS